MVTGRKREVLLPSDFLSLPDFAAGTVHGIHLIRGIGDVFRASAHYEFPKTNPADDFQARPDSQVDLDPWNDEDDK